MFNEEGFRLFLDTRAVWEKTLDDESFGTKLIARLEEFIDEKQAYFGSLGHWKRKPRNAAVCGIYRGANVGGRAEENGESSLLDDINAVCIPLGGKHRGALYHFDINSLGIAVIKCPIYNHNKMRQFSS